MRMPYVLCLLMTAFSVPAAAGDLRQEVEKISTAFAESFNKQDAAGIAALFAKDGIFVNPTGPHTDIAKTYEGTFTAGLNHSKVTVDQVWPLGADTGLGLGEIVISGKNSSGATIEIVNRWTAVYVLEGGNWKVRMLSGLPKAPPPQK